MQYCALVNTATPATGLITVGEVLTDRQAAALGEEKLDELVRCGVLRVLRSAPASPGRVVEKTEEQAAETAAVRDTEPAAAEDAEKDAEKGAEEDAEEDLPVLEAADELINDEKSAKRRKRGSAKGKEETV